MIFRRKYNAFPVISFSLFLLIFNVPAAVAAIHEVTVGDNFFSPSELTIQVGDTVRWINASGGNFHNVTSNDDAWTASPTADSFTFEVVFNETGTFGYACTIHFGSMQGTITVEGDVAASAELAVTAFSAANGPFSTGQEVLFETTVQNNGDAASGPATLDFFAQPAGNSVQAESLSSKFIPQDAILIGSANLAGIPAGGSIANQSMIVIPGSITPGNYVIGVTLNFADSNAGNNELTDADVVRFIGEFFINPGLNDAWVNDDAAFQGLFFTVFPDIGLFFLSWFTFDSVLPAGPDTATFGAFDHRWVTASGLFSPGNTVTLNIELTSGGVFNASEPLAMQDPNYGTMTIVFNHCDEAIVTYNFPGLGISGQMVLRRAAPDNVSLCEALNSELQAGS